ncbi:hypothetical protein [Bosea sp. (in: a-proteobacteria)]|uniref:hypothetical protein n=1 Tax=Bosea sp. (in: a-proteobacteria) TaxID=1871050 RepID=UPI001AC57190|nr:hypothetical protein [Bosea sp. (in: a-proteobacteria)]MBN9440699.1 hypothetical protein [Bosea sp. (in: a-proteobacteria)]
MHLEKLNPMTPPARASLIGSGNLISSAAIDFHPTTTALALKRIYARVAVSEPVALLMARHAGLIREAR